MPGDTHRVGSAIGQSEQRREEMSLQRMVETVCCKCAYDLRLLDTCRCPECGTLNYYLTDRADAREEALAHDAVLYAHNL